MPGFFSLTGCFSKTTGEMRTKEALLNHSGMNERLLLGSCVCVCLISVDRYDGTLVSGNKEYLGKK